jgi:N-acetylglucosamine-6-phosphate deacetylase
MLTKIPGFVDLQVNGFRGTDFSGPELTTDTFAQCCRAVLANGCSAFLVTLITSPIQVYRRNLPLIARVIKRDEFRGAVLGIHLEGPFISAKPGVVGAHPAASVREPDIPLLQQMQQWTDGHIRLVTLAAEAKGAQQVARWATDHGIAVSIGHSLYGPADLNKLVQAGATALTHLGNGLPNTLPRHDNPIWAGLANDALTAMVIADGHHLPTPVLKTIIRAKGVTRIAVVSDASPVAGLPPGRYQVFGNNAELAASGRLHDPQKQCLVGSSFTMLQCMNHLASLGLLSLEELLTVGFFNPLRIIGVDPAALRATSTLGYDHASQRFSISP